MTILAMPVSPYPTFPRRQGKEQTNCYAIFTIIDSFAKGEWPFGISRFPV
jgi:hypothetical protein